MYTIPKNASNSVLIHVNCFEFSILYWIRSNIREKLSLKETLIKLEEEKRSISHYEDEETPLTGPRHTGSPRHQSNGNAPVDIPQIGQRHSPTMKHRQLTTHKEPSKHVRDGESGSFNSSEDYKVTRRDQGQSPRAASEQGSSPQPQTRLKLIASVKRPTESGASFDNMVEEAKSRSKKYEILLKPEDSLTS